MPDQPEFPPVSTAEWEAQIEKDLRGADYQQKLYWRSLEGFQVRPYYRQEDLAALDYLRGSPGHPPYHRSAKEKDNRWRIRQDIRVRDMEIANHDALALVHKGVDSIGFDLSAFSSIHVKQLKLLLHRFPLAKIAVHFTHYDNALELLPMLAELAANQHMDPAGILGSIEADPLGALAERGNYLTEMYADMSALQEGIDLCRDSLPAFHPLVVKASLFHNAGATVTQALGYTLAMGAEYLVQLTEIGMQPGQILPHMRFRLATGSSYFLEIAKFRAARYLWSKIQEGFGLAKPFPMYLYATTSLHNQSLYDSHANLLRSTTAAMSAAIGGVDELSVQAFSGAFKTDDPFADRVARNTQLILKEEAYLDRVIDPASGSYYIEQLTDRLVEFSWNLFLEVQDRGGFLKCLHEGSIQDAIRKSAEEKDHRLAERKEVILGTNQYPNFDEAMNPSIEVLADLECALPEDQRIIEPITAYRRSRRFDQLRLRTERAARKRPLVFMLTHGNLAMRRARAMFACNFFACAGFEVMDNVGFATVEEGMTAALRSGADILVLCSSDEEYPLLAAGVAARINETGPSPIPVIAGYPKEHLESIRKSGISIFIHLRSNLLEELTRFQEMLGIKSKKA